MITPEKHPRSVGGFIGTFIEAELFMNGRQSGRCRLAQAGRQEDYVQVDHFLPKIYNKNKERLPTTKHQPGQSTSSTESIRQIEVTKG